MRTTTRAAEPNTEADRGRHFGFARLYARVGGPASLASLFGEGGAPVEVPYQPLRVPTGWRIDWNTLFELDPTEENVRGGFFGGSSLFSATHEGNRLWVDVEW